MMFTKKRILLCLGLFAAVSMSYAGPIEFYLQKKQEENVPLIANKTTQLAYFKQLRDHNDPAAGTFNQRYYIDETYGNTDDSPVFFYICGEATCTPRSLNGAIRNYARKYHAKLVALEHRYYGESLPFNSFSASDLRLLTTEAALDDLAYFQRYLKNVKNWQGTWIAFGGSYPGSLSAYYRLKFPYLVAGALASSAPVMAKENFIEYDTHVTQVAGEQCANQIREVVREVEAGLENPVKLSQLKALFDASEVNDPIDFLYIIADTGAGAIQYGQKDAFCEALSSSTKPLQGYANYAKKMYRDLGINAVDMTVQGAMSENPADYKNGVGMRQWYYQSCTEYGYWQNANPDPSLSTRSSLINLDYHRNACQRLFGLVEPARTTELNTTFYYPLMNVLVSNIFFTNGEQDPWSNLSLAEKNGNAINDRLTYQLIQGAAHCDDLHTPSSHDSESLIQARQTMESLLNEWLKE